MSRKTYINIVACLLSLFPHLIQAQSLTEYEYWFDDDFSGRLSGSVNGSEAVVKTSVDASQLDNGVHKFSFRVIQSDGKYSAISSSLFLKRTAAQSSMMEYWFDDKFDQRESLSISNTEDEQEFNLDLRDNTKFPMGFHKLNLRITLEGEGGSAIYSSPVLKLSAGTATALEYWIDDDRTKVHTINGKLASDGKDYIFASDLDLGDVSPGYHRLYCRAVSNSKRTASAVTMTPIIVKSRYNVENPEDLKVTELAYWFDDNDEESEVEYVAHPNNVIKYDPYKFDTRGLAEGSHTLHVQAGNSAGIWNGPVDISFTKAKAVDPVIVANASVEDGIVTMKFNSVPNGFLYNFVRQYPSGKKVKVSNVRNTEYPVALQSIDAPAPGSYTYYIVGKYTDADGVVQEVRSGDVAVTIEKAAETVKRGSIHGALRINGKAITYPWFVGTYFVYINGTNATDSKYPFKKEEFGHFRIDDIPYGTELSIGVGYYDGGLSSKLITLTMNENTSNNIYYFDCSEDGEDGFMQNNDSYDLVVGNNIHLTPNAWELQVRNKSAYRTWSGNIIVKVISKEAFEMFEKQKNGTLSSSYFLFNSNAVYYEPSYMTCAETHVRFDKKESKTLVLDIIDLPKSNKNEEFYVCVFSQKDGEKEMKEVGDNPQTLKFNPYDYNVAIVDGFKTYMKGYAEVMKYIKKFSAWSDPFKLEIQSLGSAFDLWVKTLEKGEMDLKELNDDIVDVSIKSTGMLLNSFFSDMHNMVRNSSKMLKETDIYKGMEQLDLALGVINAGQLDDNQKYFELARQVLKLSKTLGSNPVIDCYKIYFDVGDAMASAVERISNTISGYYLWDRLARGNGIYKIKVRRYTNDTKKKEYFRGQDFYPHREGIHSDIVRHQGQIESISIELINPQQKHIKAISLPLKEENVVLDDDGITIQNVVFNNVQDFYPACEAWMTITWRNKRVTRVPLLNQEFVKVENLHKDVSVPLIMTLELQSETYMHVESIPNIITIVKP